MVNLTYIQIINHTQRLSNSLHAAKECRSSCGSSQAQRCCLSPWLIHPLFSPPFLAVNCMCFECACAGVHWPLHTGGELLNSSPLHPSQLSLARALNRRLLGLLELNHNYLPSSGGGESVHCVIPISPPDMKNARRIQRGNIMSVSWIWLARQNLRRGYSRPWVALTALSLPSLSFHPSLPSSFLLSTSFNTSPPYFSLVLSPLHIPPSLSSLLPFQSTTAATVPLPAKKKKKICLSVRG